MDSVSRSRETFSFFFFYVTIGHSFSYSNAAPSYKAARTSRKLQNLKFFRFRFMRREEGREVFSEFLPDSAERRSRYRINSARANWISRGVSK